MTRRLLVSLIVPAILSSISISGAATHRVPADYPTIMAGIIATIDGDTVLVADGTFSGPGNRDIDFGGRAITVKSENGPGATAIDCENAGRGFNFHNHEGVCSKVTGFSVINGYVGGGGGIFCEDSSPVISGCIIDDNYSTDDGGGIYCHHSSPVIMECSITGNTADGKNGGGICCYYSSPTISGCTINENSIQGSWGGGGIFCKGSSTAIDNCIIDKNLSGVFGGGICCVNASITIRGCRISGNYAISEMMYSGGGGIYCTGCSPTVSDCIIIDNYAYSCGGGIYGDRDSYPAVNDCSISGNTGYYMGGGIFCFESWSAISGCTISGNTSALGGGISCSWCSADIVNCTITENTASRGGGILVSTMSATSITNCIIRNNTGEIEPPFPLVNVSYSNIMGGWEGEGNIDSDPLFLTEETGDYQLSILSPCIDAGDPESEAVPWGGSRRDMGAREFDIGWYLDDTGRIIRKPAVSGIKVLLYDPPVCIDFGGTVDFEALAVNSDITDRTFDLIRFIFYGVEADTVILSDSPVTLGPEDFAFYPFSYTVPEDYPQGSAALVVEALSGSGLLHQESFLTRISYCTHKQAGNSED